MVRPMIHKLASRMRCVKNSTPHDIKLHPDLSVITEMGCEFLRSGRPGLYSSQWQVFFSLLSHSDQLRGSPSRQFLGFFSPGTKPQGEHDTNGSSKSSSEVKNSWSLISTLPIRLHGEAFRQRKDFTFIFKRM
jgi:hypothetical protein